MKTTEILANLRADVEGDGFEPGTEEFEREYRARKVPICRDLRGVETCYACPHQHDCTLLRDYMRDLAYAPTPNPTSTTEG
jgi:hypothetical protein